MQTHSYSNRVKSCSFCEENVRYIDYKDIKNLRKHLSPYARIMGAMRTGTCAKHQRGLEQAVKRARFMGLLPYLTR